MWYLNTVFSLTSSSSSSSSGTMRLATVGVHCLPCIEFPSSAIFGQTVQLLLTSVYEVTRWLSSSTVMSSNHTGHALSGSNPGQVVHTRWQLGVAVASLSHERSHSTLSPFTTGMGARHWRVILLRYVTKPTRST